MSRRSVASSTYSRERRVSKHRVTDDDLFRCVTFQVPFYYPPLTNDCLAQLCPPSRVNIFPFISLFNSWCLTGINRRFLSYLILPKPTSPAIGSIGTTASASAGSNGDTPREKDREHSSRISGAISNSITSIGDVFRDVTARDGSKNVKFPEKLLKVLEHRLENIAMGKDPACVCPSLPSHHVSTLVSLLIASRKVIRTSSSEERWPSSMASSRWIRSDGR
jgi:hypothetical protein